MPTENIQIKKLFPKPINDRICIETLEHDKVTKGGIIVPDSSRELKERRLRGTVIAVGDGVLTKGPQGQDILRPFRVKVGQDVLYTQYAGSLHEVDGRKLCFQLESEIVAVFEETE